jgi:hypothetical protein
MSGSAARCGATTSTGVPSRARQARARRVAPRALFRPFIIWARPLPARQVANHRLARVQRGKRVARLIDVALDQRGGIQPEHSAGHEGGSGGIEDGIVGESLDAIHGPAASDVDAAEDAAVGILIEESGEIGREAVPVRRDVIGTGARPVCAVNRGRGKRSPRRAEQPAGASDRIPDRHTGVPPPGDLVVGRTDFRAVIARIVVSGNG